MRGTSGCKDASRGVGGVEWFNCEDEGFERRTKLPSGSIMYSKDRSSIIEESSELGVVDFRLSSGVRGGEVEGLKDIG